MKYFFFLTAFACLFVSCSTNDDAVVPEPGQAGPTLKERNMVKEQMTWRLDSVEVIKNYQQPNESRYMAYAGEDINVLPLMYTFYPCDYQFPEDLVFHSDMEPGLIHQISEQFNEAYCKYLTTYYGEPVAAGYLTYYKDLFALYGLQQGGWVEFMIREADTNWNTEVWTCAYNSDVEHDGTVNERIIEYYSRVNPDDAMNLGLPGSMCVTDLDKTSALVICSLPDGATGWNLSYRKEEADGEQEMRWVTIENLTTRSYTIENLKPATDYVVRLQAVFGEDQVSGWTRALPFTTLAEDAAERENKQELAFADYKKVKKDECDAMEMPAIDDKHCSLLIDQAKQAVEALAFDENKSFDENLEALDAIVDQLAIDLAIHRASVE